MPRHGRLSYYDAARARAQERLRSAVCALLTRVARLLGNKKSQLVFLINNYELVLGVLREAAADPADAGNAGADRGATAQFFSEQLGAQLHLLVEEELADQFNPLIVFVKRAEAAYKAAETQSAPRAPLPQFGPEDAEPLLRDFSLSWKTSIEAVHRSIVASFGNTQRSLDILQRTLSQVRLPPEAKEASELPCLTSVLTVALARAVASVLHAPHRPRGRACDLLRRGRREAVQGSGVHCDDPDGGEAHGAAPLRHYHALRSGVQTTRSRQNASSIHVPRAPACQSSPGTNGICASASRSHASAAPAASRSNCASMFALPLSLRWRSGNAALLEATALAVGPTPPG